MENSLVKESAGIAFELNFIPLLLRGKIPLFKKWTDITMEQAKETFRKSRSAHNVGILTGAPSGVIVIDIEKEYLKDWKNLLKEHGGLKDTLTIGTGDSGIHVYFNYYPELADIRNGAKIKIPYDEGKIAYIDIRTTGGNAVWLYSIHPETGKEYLPIAGWHEHDDQIDIDTIDMPQWLIDAIREAQSKIGRGRKR